MELRKKRVMNDNRLYCVNPPNVPALLLYNQHIDIISDDAIVDFQNESYLEETLI